METSYFIATIDSEEAVIEKMKGFEHKEMTERLGHKTDL
jgi:hypothetical protein